MVARCCSGGVRRGAARTLATNGIQAGLPQLLGVVPQRGNHITGQEIVDDGDAAARDALKRVGGHGLERGRRAEERARYCGMRPHLRSSTARCSAAKKSYAGGCLCRVLWRPGPRRRNDAAKSDVRRALDEQWRALWPVCSALAGKVS